MPPLSNNSNNNCDIVHVQQQEQQQQVKSKKCKSSDTKQQKLQSKRRKNTVHFAQDSSLCQIQYTLHYSDYTRQEKDSTWYKRLHYRFFKEEMKNTGCLMMKQEEGMVTEEIDDIEYCSRGLETLLPLRSQQKFQNRQEAYREVFLEQDLQWENGIIDTELLADLYYDCCAHSRKSAHMMGLEDAKFARSYCSQ